MGREGTVDRKSGGKQGGEKESRRYNRLFHPYLLLRKGREKCFEACGKQGSRGEIVYLEKTHRLLKYEDLTFLSQIHSGITVCEEVTYSRDWVMMTFSVKTHFLCTLAVVLNGRMAAVCSTVFHTFSWKLKAAYRHLSKAGVCVSVCACE